MPNKKFVFPAPEIELRDIVILNNKIYKHNKILVDKILVEELWSKLVILENLLVDQMAFYA